MLDLARRVTFITIVTTLAGAAIGVAIGIAGSVFYHPATLDSLVIGVKLIAPFGFSYGIVGGVLLLMGLILRFADVERNSLF